MYTELINDLMLELLTCKIMNIYTSDNVKISIGISGIPKDQIEFKSFGIVVNETGRKVWYFYSNIHKIEVY